MKGISKHVDDARSKTFTQALASIVRDSGGNDGLGKVLDDLVEGILTIMKKAPTGYLAWEHTGSKNNRPAVRAAASLCYERLKVQEVLSMSTASPLAKLATEVAMLIAVRDLRLADVMQPESGWARLPIMVREIAVLRAA